MKSFEVTYIHNGETKYDISVEADSSKDAWAEGRRRVTLLIGKATVKDCKVKRDNVEGDRRRRDVGVPIGPRGKRSVREPIAFTAPDTIEQLPAELDTVLQDGPHGAGEEARDIGEVTALIKEANTVLSESPDIDGRLLDEGRRVLAAARHPRRTYRDEDCDIEPGDDVNPTLPNEDDEEDAEDGDVEELVFRV